VAEAVVLKQPQQVVLAEVQVDGREPRAQHRPRVLRLQVAADRAVSSSDTKTSGRSAIRMTPSIVS
jgi:hypothetical protein